MRDDHWMVMIHGVTQSQSIRYANSGPIGKKLSNEEEYSPIATILMCLDDIANEKGEFIATDIPLPHI